MKADREIKVRCSACGHLTRIPTITNADRIRAMTDEELAEKFSAHAQCFGCPLWNGNACYRKDCKDHWIEWLKKETTD